MSHFDLRNRSIAARGIRLCLTIVCAVLIVVVVEPRPSVAGSTHDQPTEADAGRPRRPPSYRIDIAPLLSKAGCNMGACHGNLNGKGGFKLSLRGEDPSFDYQSLTHDQSGRRISRIAPESSLVVLKPTGVVPHEGGLRFSRDSARGAYASRLDRWGRLR